MKCTGQDVIRIIRLLEEGGVPAWLDGGWGIDALLKKETRPHEDVDLVIPLEYLTAAELALGEAGFSTDSRQTDFPTRLVLRSSEGLEVDIHPVTFKPDGSAVHIDTEGGGGPKYIYVYSSGGLSGIGAIDGCVVHCTTAVEQIRQKVERVYSPWSKARIRERGISADIEDIMSLLEVFGSDSIRLAPVGTELDAGTAGNAVDDAAEQFCLRHVASLNAQHSRLAAQHAELSTQYSRLRTQYAELSTQYAELSTQHAGPGERHAQLIEQLAELDAENAELIAYIKAIQASTCWRLTAPIRWTARWLGIDRLKSRDQQRA